MTNEDNFKIDKFGWYQTREGKKYKIIDKFDCNDIIVFLAIDDISCYHYFVNGHLAYLSKKMK